MILNPQRIIILAALLWPMVWENATQAYQNAQVISIDKVFLMPVEILLLLVGCGYVLSVNVERKLKLFPLGFLVAYMALSLLSGLANGSTFDMIGQVTYVTLRPFLLLFILVNLSFQESDLKFALGCAITIAFLNTMVIYFQYQASGVYGDEAAGLMYHAHTASNLNVIVILLLFTAYLRRGTPWAVGLVIFFLPSLLITAHEKATLLMLPCLFFLMLVNMGTRIIKYIVLVCALLPAIYLSSSGVRESADTTAELSAFAFDNIDKLGVIKAYVDLYEIFRENPRYALYGMGPGKYGSIYNTYGGKADSLRRTNPYSAEIYYSTVSVEVEKNRRSLWAPRSNLLLAVASECGLLGLTIFLGMFCVVALKLHQVDRWYRSVRLRSMAPDAALGSIAGLLFLLLLGSTYLLTGYNAQANVFPLMVVIGAVLACPSTAMANLPSISPTQSTTMAASQVP